jgi:N-methylhydantoinase A
MDIAEVGAGGGSIATLDRAGGLRVGPHSAGAVPGPACYRRGGTQPTLTDANVVLGYIRTGRLAGGEVSIDGESARRAVHDHVAAPLGLDLLRAAEGIHRIANARMMRALRAVSTERGRDPRGFTLLAYGGSGPIHAAGLAHDLFIGRVLVPPLPGLFSAGGLLFSGVEHHDVHSCLLGGPVRVEALEQVREEMRRRMLAQFRREGFAPEQVNLDWSADARYRGQASEIRVGLDTGRWTEGTLAAMRAAFEAEHGRLYGHRSDPDHPVELVAVRLVGREADRGGARLLAPVGRYEPAEASRLAYFGAVGCVDTPVLARHQVNGARDGPLLIDEYDSTTVVPPSWRVRRDEHHNLILEPHHA